MQLARLFTALALFLPALPVPSLASTSSTVVAAPATELAFNELLERRGDRLAPTEKLRSLVGRRVRIVGYMVDMELPPAGGFYLAPRPVHCDEAGGGSADLPPESVLVEVRSAGDKALEFRPGRLVATGVLQFGPRVESDGRVSTIRLLLDHGQVPRSRKETSSSKKQEP